MFPTKPMRQIATINNVSDKYKCEWIAPERTGSRQLAEVLTYYGFKRNGTPLFNNGRYNYSHLSLFDEHYSDYKLICSARNPYGRVYSLFKNFYQSISDKSIVGFKQFLTNDLPKGQTLQMVLNPRPNLSYDYVIRLEHLVDDLLKLPFISDVLTETQLRMICTHGKEIDNWEPFYDNEMKEIVYNLTEYQFKAWGYNK
jgi:hypothetical protein